LDIPRSTFNIYLAYEGFLIYSWDLAEFYTNPQKTLKQYLCKFVNLWASSTMMFFIKTRLIIGMHER
jgi:hypothetical protein